ncbi:cyclophane-forming radical SAM peptide maturase AmcB [Kitasatospora sp. NPDC004531]
MKEPAPAQPETCSPVLEPRTRYLRWIADRPRQVVLQPTTFCNLDCSYCYLPGRAVKSAMPVEVAEAVARSVAELTATGGPPVRIIWHAGEPLALGRARFAELLAPFEALRAEGRVQHAVRTNATLVNDRWCDLLAAHGVRVGVSIDGPRALNARRVDRAGRPAHDRILRGIDRLREHGLPFSVISVVSRENLNAPEALLDHLSCLGGRSIGLNIEEHEGANTSRATPDLHDTVGFWARVIAWSHAHPEAPPVRELDRLGAYLRMVRDGPRPQWEDARHDPIPTVAAGGDVALLSPELADTTAPAYDDFRAGNVLERPLAEILADAHRLRYVAEFLTGLDNCRGSCEFFDFCRGSQAGNRYFEHGTFTATETAYCRSAEQALVLAAADITRKDTTA